ncbi:hypothetical protein Tsp_08581 [Trichinella spiralis]|uniref:hypothetical protein n=1 Tax=Trichinella spiralis TaxID=6334 RepID=UPI0001EFD925|nr:hypothetical protein Tsp_08581 [Trichinella spiralis]
MLHVEASRAYLNDDTGDGKILNNRRRRKICPNQHIIISNHSPPTDQNLPSALIEIVVQILLLHQTRGQIHVMITSTTPIPRRNLFRAIQPDFKFCQIVTNYENCTSNETADHANHGPQIKMPHTGAKKPTMSCNLSKNNQNLITVSKFKNSKPLNTTLLK